MRGVVAKTEAEYGKVQRALVQFRRSGYIPYAAIRDATRRRIHSTTFVNIDEGLNTLAETYRRSLWNEDRDYVEIWPEKDALSGVIEEITRQFDVNLMVARGFASETFLAEAALEIANFNRPKYIYRLGDHDPSGREAGDKIEHGLRRLAPNVDITFERIAVTMDQIEELALPTRPTKYSDTRAKKFESIFGVGSVELDAIHPDILRNIADWRTARSAGCVLQRTARGRTGTRPTPRRETALRVRKGAENL